MSKSNDRAAKTAQNSNPSTATATKQAAPATKQAQPSSKNDVGNSKLGDLLNEVKNDSSLFPKFIAMFEVINAELGSIRNVAEDAKTMAENAKTMAEEAKNAKKSIKITFDGE